MVLIQGIVLLGGSGCLVTVMYKDVTDTIRSAEALEEAEPGSIFESLSAIEVVQMG